MKIAIIKTPLVIKICARQWNFYFRLSFKNLIRSSLQTPSLIFSCSLNDDKKNEVENDKVNSVVENDRKNQLD